jgi:hypothetical protein
MTKLTALAAAGLLAGTLAAGIAAPAQAQGRYGWGSPGFYDADRSARIREQIWDLDDDLELADRRGFISDSDVFSLRREVRALRNWYEMSARNGLSFQEVRYLQDRVNRIRDKLRLERYSWDREDYWRGYGNTGTWDDRNGYTEPTRSDRDWDNDGVPNRIDRDWNDDGPPDRADGDLDNDAIPDSIDRDRDNDGVPNSEDPEPYRRY